MNPHRWRMLLLVLALALALAPVVNWHLQLKPEDPLSSAPPKPARSAPAVPGSPSWRWFDTGIESIPRIETMDDAALDFSPDGRWLAGSWSDGVRVFDTGTGERVAWVPISQARSAVFSADGRTLVVSCASGFESWRFDPSREVGSRLGMLRRWRDATDSGEFSMDAARRRLLVGVNPWDMEILDLAQAGFSLALRHPQSAPVRVAFAPGAGALAPDGAWAAGGASELRGPCVWDARTGAVLRTALYDAPGQPRTRCAADPGGRFLAVCDRLGYHVFATADWREVFSCSAETDDTIPNALAFSADGRVLAVAIARRGVRMLSTNDWRPLSELASPEPLPISALAFAPDAGTLAAATLDGRAGWWALGSKVRIATPAATEIDPQFRPAEARTYPPPAGHAGCLDLSLFLNADLGPQGESQHNLATGFAGLAAGLQRLDGVWFDVRGIAVLAGTSLRDPFPVELRTQPIGCRCARLHFLHGCIVDAPDAAVVGEYVIHFADGTSNTISLHYGWDTLDCTAEPDELNGRAASLAWTNGSETSHSNPTPATLHLYRFTWTNPNPGTAITSFDFCSAMTTATPFLLAVSTEAAEN